MPTPTRAYVPADIEGLLAHLGVVVTRRVGDEVQGLCPQHEKYAGKAQSTPHWYLNAETGLHQCWSCGYRGSLLGLATDLTGSPWRALATIRQHGLDLSNLDIKPWNPPSRQPRVLHLPEGRVPDAHCATRRLDPDLVWDYGVRWDGTHWIIPVHDLESGALLGWQEKSKHVFRNRPPEMEKSKSLFGALQADPQYPAIVVESPLDVIRLASAGLGNGMASYGASVSENQIRHLLTFPEVILALDNDEAGWNETRRIRDRYARRGPLLLATSTTWPAKDPGDMTDREIDGAFHDLQPLLTAPLGSSPLPAGRAGGGPRRLVRRSHLPVPGRRP